MRTVPFPWIPAAALALLAGCSQPNTYAPPPPPAVTVARPLRMRVTEYLEETGTTEAVERAAVRARVQGVLEEVVFQAGSTVSEGDVLYRIEPQVYEAGVAAAEAELASAGARRDKARIEKERQERLRDTDPGATSEVAIVSAIAEFNGAEAAVKAAQAALDQARLDLSYTTVTAPITGRVGKTEVKRGNLVGMNEATYLTDVVNYDPIYVNFNISERALLDLRASRPRENAGDRYSHSGAVPVYLRRATDDGFPFRGQMEYADLAVDQSMGTFMIRGILPNPNDDLIPGLFVRVRIPIGTREDALLVPERAVAADQQGRYVLIVGQDKKVTRRNVRAGMTLGGLVVLEEGLQGEEWVVVDGVQRARPGVEVTPEPTELTAPAEALESVSSSTSGDIPPAEGGNAAPAGQSTGPAPAGGASEAEGDSARQGQDGDS
jgi:RND family efflux transporter MFP subunit